MSVDVGDILYNVIYGEWKHKKGSHPKFLSRKQVIISLMAATVKHLKCDFKFYKYAYTIDFSNFEIHFISAIVE